jgi:hypothetical protein
MSENQPIWINWARALHQWGIDKGVASLLEVGGSLNLLFAQLLYISQPLLSGVISTHSLDALARMLENSMERQEFIVILREGASHEPAT